jgi:hypothetical protein
LDRRSQLGCRELFATIDVVEQCGTPFTAEEFLNSIAQSSEEMSKEQLRSVAGGGSFDENFHKIMNSIAFSVLLESHARESGFYALNGVDRGRLFAPPFLQGTSRIGYTFLRIVTPQLPFVLLLG